MHDASPSHYQLENLVGAQTLFLFRQLAPAERANNLEALYPCQR
jgi:hypothetical protein